MQENNLLIYTKSTMSKNVTLSKELAVKMYNGEDEQMKQFALENYPELGFKITDRIKCMQDVYTTLGVCEPTHSKPKVKAFEDLLLLVECLNEGTVLDFNNTNEAKWYPYWDMRGELWFHYSYYNCNFSYVPAHLCFKNEALCSHAVKYFYDTYKAYMC